MEEERRGEEGIGEGGAEGRRREGDREKEDIYNG